MLFTAVALLLGANALPLVFLEPGDIEDAHNVRIEAQVATVGQVVQPKDPAKPTLWHWPIAVEQRDGRVRVWYQRVNKGEKEYADQRTLCLGIYTANGAWELPALSSAAPAWGGPNNVVMTRAPYKPTWGGFNVFQMTSTADGYRLLYWDQPEHGEAGAMLASSRDGEHWEKDPRGTVFTEHNDAFTLLKKDGAYLLFQTVLEDWPDKPFVDNLGKWRRVEALRESSDLVTWTKPAPLIRPDAEDAPTTEFYYMKAFPYAGRYLGLLMKYYADPEKPGQHSAILSNELMVSDDARTWKRPFRSTNVGFWSSVDPVTVNERLTFFAYDDKTGVALRTYRPLGMTAAHTEDTGDFVTRPFAMPAAGVTLNADARAGAIDVELLDANKKPVAGAEPVRLKGIDGTAAPLVWPKAVVEAVRDQTFRLRLRISKGSVYAISSASP